jgi:hypothetical protein
MKCPASQLLHILRILTQSRWLSEHSLRHGVEKQCNLFTVVNVQKYEQVHDSQPSREFCVCVCVSPLKKLTHWK